MIAGMRAWPVIVVLSSAVLRAQPAPHLPPLDRALPPRAEAIYRAVEPRVDRDAAMAIVTPMAPLWRLAGNPQFDHARVDRRTAHGGGHCHPLRHHHVFEPGLGDARRGAAPRRPAGEVVLSRAQDRVPLAINSFPTPAGGTTATLVDGAPAPRRATTRAGTVKGAVVLAEARSARCGTRR